MRVSFVCGPDNAGILSRCNACILTEGNIQYMRVGIIDNDSNVLGWIRSVIYYNYFFHFIRQALQKPL